MNLEYTPTPQKFSFTPSPKWVNGKGIILTRITNLSLKTYCIITKRDLKEILEAHNIAIILKIYKHNSDVSPSHLKCD